MLLYYTQVIIYSTFSIIELYEKSKILYYKSLILRQIELNLIIVKVEIFVFSVQIDEVVNSSISFLFYEN